MELKMKLEMVFDIRYSHNHFSAVSIFFECVSKNVRTSSEWKMKFRIYVSIFDYQRPKWILMPKLILQSDSVWIVIFTDSKLLYETNAFRSDNCRYWRLKNENEKKKIQQNVSQKIIILLNCSQLARKRWRCNIK